LVADDDANSTTITIFGLPGTTTEQQQPLPPQHSSSCLTTTALLLCGWRWRMLAGTPSTAWLLLHYGADDAMERFYLYGVGVMVCRASP
jgi:hypothetical protein